MSDNQRLEAKLAAFRDNPKSFMDTIPEKETIDNNTGEPVTVFTEEEVGNLDYVSARDEYRRSLLTVDVGRDRAAIESRDLPQNLVDKLEVKTLEAIEAKNLKEASLAESPWSDDYWAIYSGILGKRYADSKYPNEKDWQENFNYIRDNDAKQILAEGSQDEIDRLSPSEKYDALVGDSNLSLTKSMWAQGRSYYDRYGKVESWMGICHGWAPAAYMMDRPKYAVNVKLADGGSTTFYPADIKALASQLWANHAGRVNFIGGRCNDKEPKKDEETGRITSQACFDTNPATWHLSIVNQIGLSKRSFVLDVTFDFEVWNQPVYAYSFTYFNPKTDRAVSSIADAKVSLADYDDDKFKKYRNNRTKSLVGIAMKVEYVVETKPDQKPTDSAADDMIRRVEYLYDLELDGDDNIIGGEWYNNAHPDFLWTAVPNARAETSYDDNVSDDWSSRKEGLPDSWKENAIKASKASKGTPLAVIVEKLIAFSQDASAGDSVVEIESGSGGSTTGEGSGSTGSGSGSSTGGGSGSGSSGSDSSGSGSGSTTTTGEDSGSTGSSSSGSGSGSTTGSGSTETGSGSTTDSGSGGNTGSGSSSGSSGSSSEPTGLLAWLRSLFRSLFR